MSRYVIDGYGGNARVSLTEHEDGYVTLDMTAGHKSFSKKFITLSGAMLALKSIVDISNLTEVA